MADDIDPLLPPQVLERMAEDEPRKVRLWDYLKAMETLRGKGFSYQDVADWINEKLGSEVTRNQVAYTLNAHPLVKDMEDEENQTEDLADQAEDEKYHS
jgi:hypothetical protein